MEVCVHPKPGLVTRHGGGAHTDMSILTFAAGSAVLAKAFSDLQILGMKHNGNYQELFGKVRRYGVSAEQELLRVTKESIPKEAFYLPVGYWLLPQGLP